MYVTVSKHIGPDCGEGDMCVTVSNSSHRCPAQVGLEV